MKERDGSFLHLVFSANIYSNPYNYLFITYITIKDKIVVK